MGRKNGSSGNNHDNDNLIGLYLRNPGEFPLLTSEEEIRYGRILKSKTVSEKEKNQVRKKFILSNIGLVVSIAKKYTGKHLDIMDLIQEGTIGLMVAVIKFDPELGNRFSTYATVRIKQFITRALADKEELMRKPVYMIDMLKDYKKGLDVLDSEYNREPTENEILDYFKREEGWTALDIANVQNANRLSEITSLNKKIENQEGRDTELGDITRFLEEEDCPYEHTVGKIVSYELGEIIKNTPLTDREREVIRLRFFEEWTLERIGEQRLDGITKEMVRKIEGRALKKMRQYATLRGVESLFTGSTYQSYSMNE